MLQFGLVLMISGCLPAPVPPTIRSKPPTATAVLQTLPAIATAQTPTIEPSATPSATDSVSQPKETPSTQPTSEVRLLPERWKEWPVVPAVSARAAKLIRDGIAKGNNPRAFSKIGDCETTTEWFLADFDKSPDHYGLGPYSDLQTVIGFYKGSFSRTGVAAMRGFTAASVLNPYWRDINQCDKNETPMACELRLNRPSFALIMLGTNDASRPETFEKNLRAVIDAAIAKSVLPVLTTKADNLEGDYRLNLITAKLAYEYDIPLWNFWRAVQDQPDHGLQEDLSHLTFAPNDFSDPQNLTRAWPVRNLTALEVLDAIRKSIQ